MEVEVLFGFFVFEVNSIDRVGNQIWFPFLWDNHKDFPGQHLWAKQGVHGWIMAFIVDHDPGVGLLVGD